MCSAQEDNYDDDNYGTQGGNANQGDGDSYGPGYGSDENYANNNYAPNQQNQQNLDSEGSNNNPNSNQYSPQAGTDADDDYQGDDASAAASSLKPTVVRIKRSTDDQQDKKVIDPLTPANSAPKLRVKRHGKYYIGPVYTYVKTDKHANFKWGVSIII